MRNKTLKNVLLFVCLALLPAVGGRAQVNTDRVLAIGRNALYFEDYVLSIQYFNQVIRVKPHLAEPYFYRAVAKISLEDYRGAEEDCSLALERNPFMTEVYRCRGVARVYLGKYDEATKDFDKGLEFAPDSKQLLLCKGYVSVQREDYAQAIKDFTLTVDKYPHFKEAYLNRGYAYLQSEDTAAAMRDFEKTLELDKFSADGLAARGYVFYAEGDYDKSLADFDEALRIEPYRTGLYINRGLVRYKKNNLRGAMDDYDRVIQLDPYNVMAYYNRGILRMEVGDKNRAVEDFDRVIEMEPDNDFAIYNRAILHNDLGELNKAIQDYDKIIKAHPDFFPAYYGRGEAKMKKYDRTGAEKDYNTAMLLRQRKITKKDFAREDSLSATRKKSDTNLRNHNKLVVADKEEQMKRLSYKSESRGRVQNVNFHIEPEGNFILTYYPRKKEALHRSVYFDKRLNGINQSGKMPMKLQISNNEESMTDRLSAVFQEIESLTAQLKKNASAEGFLQRAIQFEFISDYDSAIEDFSQAITLSSPMESWIFYFFRANSRMKKWNYENALKDEVERKEAEKGDYYARKIVCEAILKDYEEVNERYPDFPFSWFNRGNTLSMMKDYRNAIANYTNAIEREPDFAEAYFNRGLCYVMIGENGKGVADLSKAGELGIYVAYNVIKRFRE